LPPFLFSASQVITPADKLEHLRMLMSAHGDRAFPLIIGHSNDESEMAKYLKDKKGLSIGLNPDKKSEKFFDIVINSKNWEPLLNILDWDQ